MNCSAEVWRVGYGLSYLPAIGASTTGVFFSKLMGDGLVFRLDTTRVWDLLYFFTLCVSYDAEVGRWCSKKLY
jgi:hypothetical protein